MKFTVRNVFDTDKTTFWDRVFFDPEYNRRLYLDTLKFKAFEIIEQTGGPGEVRTRRMRTEPASDAPTVVTKLIGGSLTYEENGRWDPKSEIWTYVITTSKMADKVNIGGRFWLEPLGDKKINRVCEVDIQVKVFGVGGAIESFIEKTTRESYEATARYTNEFIREKKLGSG